MSQTTQQDPKDLNLALWSYNLARRFNGLDGFLADMEATVIDAKAQGADLLVMPESVSEVLLSFAPADLALKDELAWMAEHTPAIIETAVKLARGHDLAILAGSHAAPLDKKEPPFFANRAVLALPDGRVFLHDKICLTPSEKDPEGWLCEPGSQVQVFEWQGARIAQIICLDSELAGLSARLADKDIDLLLVPSMTAAASGYSRVGACAKARAIELFCAVAVTGTIGQVPGPNGDANGNRGTNFGGAAVFLPCEMALEPQGRGAFIEPVSQTQGRGPLTLTGPLPLARIKALRHAGAEVWPGAYDLSNLVVSEE